MEWLADTGVPTYNRYTKMDQLDYDTLEFLSGFFASDVRVSLRYSDDVRSTKNSPRSYAPPKQESARTKAHDMYNRIKEYKKGELPEHLSDDEKKELAADLEKCNHQLKMDSNYEFTNFTIALHEEYQQEVALKKKAEKLKKEQAAANDSSKGSEAA